MLRSKERQERITSIVNIPEFGYLSVLLENLKVRDSYRSLRLVVKKGIKAEEESVKRKPKFGYGSRFRPFIPSRPETVLVDSNPRSLSSVKTRPFSRLTRSTLTYSHRRDPSSYRQRTGYLINTECQSVPNQYEHVNIDRLVIDGTLDEIFTQRKQLLTPCHPLWFPNSESHFSSEMLSTPDLPGGGLKRETTSFGVYSNLASHSRRELTKIDGDRRPEILPVVTSGRQYQLLQAVKNGDIEEVQQILINHAEINLQFVDENDRTVLHHCFDMPKRKVNCEILSALLEKKPSMIDYCKSEAPVLHNAVKLGHALSVYLLIKNGANVNLQYKRTLRTALHEAVLCGQMTAVEILLFNGAKTNIREKDGRFARDLCKDNIFQRDEYDKIEECVSSKRLEIKELYESTVQFDNIGVTLQPSSVKSTIVIIIKRQSLESSKVKISLLEEEDLSSDVFTCRVLQNPEGATVRFSLPLFDNPISSREEIVVKSGTGNTLIAGEIQAGQHGLVVDFETVFNMDRDSYICVCRPKIENWQVGKGQTVLGSVMDDQVRVHINKSSFSSRTSLTLQIIELPENVEIKEGTILANTPFYRIKAEHNLDKDITIELPKPFCFGDEGKCVVMAKSGSKWGDMDMRTDDKHNSVYFEVHQLPVIATVAMIKPGSPVETVAQEINDIFKLVSNIEFRVCFLCVTNRVENTRKFTVVVECCEVRNLDTRLRYWKIQGYQEQQDKESFAQIGVRSKQAFKIVFYDSAILRKDPRFVDLEFHRMRENVISFSVELKGKAIQFINGRIYVYAAQADDENKEEVVGKEHLASIDVNLLLNQMEYTQSMSERTSNDVKDESTRSAKSAKTRSSISLSDNRTIFHAAERRSHALEVRPRTGTKDLHTRNQESEVQVDSLQRVQESLARAMRNVDPVPEKEEIAPVETMAVPEKVVEPTEETCHRFLGDDLLDTVIEELGDDWYKIYVMAGTSFSEIEEALLNSRLTTQVKRQLFRRWRDQHQNREDKGLPHLLGALYKGGCRNVANSVQIKLKKWYSTFTEKDTDFHKWVTKAYSNSDLFVPPEYPKPMSDSYLVLMSDELPPKRDLARALQISDSASYDIIENPAYLIDGIKVMKILTFFRDRTPRGIDALEKLISCLDDLGYGKLRTYAVKCSKAWLKRTATRKDDPFRYQVDALVSKMQD